MNNCLLLPELMEDLRIISKKGKYVEGEFVIDNDSIADIRAIVTPVDQRSLELLPAGSNYNDSIKIFTKYPIDDLSEVYIVRNSTNVTYRLHQDKKFINIDDLLIYLATVDRAGEE